MKSASAGVVVEDRGLLRVAASAGVVVVDLGLLQCAASAGVVVGLDGCCRLYLRV